MRSQSVTASRRNLRHRPYAFTEHGAVMLASVLNTPLAVKASVQVVRAFLWLRRAIAASEPIQRRLDAHEERLCEHDEEFRRLHEALGEFAKEEPSPRRRIGFSP